MTKNTLESSLKHVKNVNRFHFGQSSLKELAPLLKQIRKESSDKGEPDNVVFLVDNYFRNNTCVISWTSIGPADFLDYVDTENEPTTECIDALVARLIQHGSKRPAAIVGIGGGSTMDTAKAVSTLLTNDGEAAKYQGWDLVKVPGIFKIGIPTISGTGAEATRTCVITNSANHLKLGINSDFSVFDHVIMDPELTVTVPRDQYFFTGMDAYIHCVEMLSGKYRNAIGDAYARETIRLCRQIFLEDDMQNPVNRERLMVASYLGGCAIATGYVGLVHPLSAGLSVVLGVHHCVGNCIVMRAMAEFYPAAYDEFWLMAERQKVEVPADICKNVNEEETQSLFEASMIHDKPLSNALGENYKTTLNFKKMVELFNKM